MVVKGGTPCLNEGRQDKSKQSEVRLMSKILRRIFEIEGEGRKASGPFDAFSSQENQGISQTLAIIRELTASFEKVRQEGSQTYEALGRSVQSWSRVATRTIGQVLSIMNQHSLDEEQSVETHARAEQAKSLASLTTLQHTAFYRAIAATAAGFQALGEFDFWAATQDFASAALWGSLAGAQIASLASAGGGASAPGRRPAAVVGDQGESGAGIPTSALASGAASAKAGVPSGNLTIAIMGEPEAGEWLARTLNAAVEQRGVQLTATRAQRPTYAAG